MRAALFSQISELQYIETFLILQPVEIIISHIMHISIEILYIDRGRHCVQIRF